MTLLPLEEQLTPDREALLSHPLYAGLSSENAVVCFMERHVFAVWDFMSLVKSLQQRLTCVGVPWLPTGNPVERRFLNEIVLDEESDLDADGRPRAHFEMYLDAMEAVGAETEPITRFIDALQGGASVPDALETARLSPGVRAFVETTLALSAGSDVEVAAAFAYGRELVIPPMFEELVAKLRDRDPERFGPLAFYLERHIQTDGEQHGPIAHRLVDRLIGDDAHRAALAVKAARRALQARIDLWDEINEAIEAAS